MATRRSKASKPSPAAPRAPQPFPRRGAWAVLDGRVGIIAELGETAEFHVTDEKGDTTLVIPNVPRAALTQPTHEQIPKARRPAPEHAERLGYATA